MSEPRVVVVGGGFGGLNAARALSGLPVSVTVVDRENHHVFQPLLYQVATAALSPGDISSPIRAVLRRARNVTVWMAEVTGIDLAQRCLYLADGRLEYDYLILAPGVRHAYFGHPEWEHDAPGLKSIADALEMRRRILQAFEQAERTPDPAARAALLTFVVIGAGPTGVELAGAIAEIARHTVARDFRSIDPTAAKVVLVEAGPRILPSFDEGLAAAARRSLEKIGVEVRTGTPVTGVTAGGVRLVNQELPARTALWAAGVAASPLAKTLGVELDRQGRVNVAPDLTVPGHPEVYVVGDLAHLDGAGGRPLPGVAPVAIQQGRAAAVNIRRTLAGLARLPFRYQDRGSMATVGRAAAIFDRGGLKLSGFVAWLGWLFVHILFLIGFRNRGVVMLSWIWSYLTWRRGVRLITSR